MHASLLGMQRALRIQWSALALATIFMVFALGNLLVNDAVRMAGISLAASLVALVGLIVVMRTSHVRLAGNLVVGCLSVQVFGEMLINGGLGAPATPIALLIVPAAVLVAPKRDVLPWLALVMVALVGLALFDFNGLTMPLELSTGQAYVDKTLSLLLGVLVATGMVAAFSSHSIRAVRELDQERAIFQRQANYDALTGLPNRNHFYPNASNQVQQVALSGQHGVLVFLDIDGFKSINDNLGHEAGDELLIEFGRRLRNTFPHPTLVARLAGDEFVVFIVHEKLAQLDEDIARAVVQLTERQFSVGGAMIRVSASFGIARLGTDGTSLREIMSAADESMYAMKRRSKPSRVTDRIATETVLNNEQGERLEA